MLHAARQGWNMSSLTANSVARSLVPGSLRYNCCNHVSWSILIRSKAYT